LALGFPLLTLGVATGMLWVASERGTVWTGTVHEIWSTLAWAVCALLVAARFGAGQGSRQAAVAAVGGFAFLLFAVVGVELLARGRPRPPGAARRGGRGVPPPIPALPKPVGAGGVEGGVLPPTCNRVGVAAAPRRLDAARLRLRSFLRRELAERDLGPELDAC